MATKKTQVIIHASFVQPEWESPWTNEIIPQEKSTPYNTIYEQFNTTCYSPNSASRVLDNKGRIKKIINNYEYASFDFSHSILNWLKKNDSTVYNKIIEADKKSVANHNGHGNAIAQTYNNSILPLQSFEDKKTEIIWGLKSFSYHFGREAEGIWLSELAVDYKTVDLLIELGVGFIILSPDQITACKETADADWQEIGDSNFLPNQAFKIKRAHGEIAVFVYDKNIVTGISFQHLLRDSDNLAGNIINSPLITKESDTIVIASDGGVYGYYEPFGDMCLASLIENYHNNNQTIQLINFGEYLADNPPQIEIALSLGEDGLGSSWSCPHGVGRWYKDCGCRVGGKENWNQDWKVALKESLDFLKKNLDEIYLSSAKERVIDPEGLRNNYIKIINDRENFDYEAFFAKYTLENLDLIDISHLLCLLEMQKNILAAYSSNAWFYADISNIHTIQALKFAYRALSYIDNGVTGATNGVIGVTRVTKEEIKLQFEKKLETIVPNIPEYKNIKSIIEKFIYPETPEIPEMPKVIDDFNIANNIIALLVNNKNINKRQFSFFDNYDYEKYEVNSAINNTIYKGFVEVKNKLTQSQIGFYFLFCLNSQTGDFENYISIESKNDMFDRIGEAILNNSPHTISDKSIRLFRLKDLSHQIKEYIINYNFRYNNRQLLTNSVSLVDPVLNLLQIYKDTKTNPMYLVESIAKTSIEAYFHNLSYKLNTFPDRNLYIYLIKLFDLINYFNLKIDLRAIKKVISNLIYDHILLMDKIPLDDALLVGENNNICEKVIILIQFTDRIALQVEKGNAENIIYEILQKMAPILIENIKQAQNSIEKKRNIDKLKKIVRLATTFNINVANIKRLFADKLRNNVNSSRFL